MKTIIAGSRNVTDFNQVSFAIKSSGFDITEIVSGAARGVDRLGEKYAEMNNLPVMRFIPDWNALGKRAGFVRNSQMADYADALVAIWDGTSVGTKHMISDATKKGLKIYVHVVDK